MPTRLSTSGSWRESNFAMSCIIIFCTFAVLYAASISLPALLQALFGYDALAAGLVLSPSGVSSIAMMVIVGILLGRGFDARWLIAAGLVIVAVEQLLDGLHESADQPLAGRLPRMVLTAGLGLIFAPINVAAFKYTPMHLRGAAVGLLALLRNEGGSVGTSMSQTMQERREQFHHSRVDEFLDPFNPDVNSFLEQAAGLLLAADRRSGRVAANGPANAGEPPRAAGGVAGLLRRLLDLGRAGRGACRSGVFDETLGGREGCACRGGIGGCATCEPLTGC